MFNLEISKSALVAAAILGASVLAANVQASGYHSSSGKSGLQSPYNMGKQVFYKKVACDSCPLPGKNLDKQGAMSAIDQLNSNEMLMQKLSGKERQAATYYLQKRHKISIAG